MTAENIMIDFNKESLVLAERAVACENWRWMPGMKAGVPDSWYRACDQPETLYWQGETNGGWTIIVEDNWIPDFRDAATLGCLQELVREISGDPWLCAYVRARADGSESEWTGIMWERRFSAESEQEVLIKMLEVSHE
jgi:hypothetical protein